MEVERLVRGLQDIVRYCHRPLIEAFGPIWVKERAEGYPELNRKRLYATAAKALANDPSIADGERLAGAFAQMTRCGDAEPYEVCDE